MSIAATPIHDTLAEPHPQGRALDDIAESLLAKVATEPTACRPVAHGDLTDPKAQRLFRSLLACLARKSAQESRTEFNPYGGTLSFVRPGPERTVRITGTFDNRPGAVRLAFHAPEPCPPTATAPGARGTSGALVEVLCPAVVDYWVDDTGFALASDLARLDRVRTAGAAESAVLYCNRIVEAMARDTVGTGLDSPTPSLAALIGALDKYHFLPGPLRRLLHLLRSIGNDARHAIQPVSAADDDVAFVILLRWFQWVFCEAASGPKLSSITLPNRPTESLLPRGLSRLVDDAATTGEAVLAELSGHATDGGAILSPLLLAAAAEALLSRDRMDQAWVVLDVGSRRFQRDRRLRQLVGLYWSRCGWAERSVELLHRARRELEPLLPQGGGVATDEETFGILGGVYKRLSDLDPAASGQWLGKCRDTYRAGWERSGRANDYLGINAATVALWLGSEGVAEVAQPIRDGLAALEARLRAAGGARPLTYWDQVTWAEAELLLGEWDRAGELYQNAFERFAARTGDIAVSVGQAKRILERVGQSVRAAAVLGSWAV